MGIWFANSLFIHQQNVSRFPFIQFYENINILKVVQVQKGESKQISRVIKQYKFNAMI